MTYLCHSGSKARTGWSPSHSGGFASLDLFKRLAWNKKGSKFESPLGPAKCGREPLSAKLATLVTTTVRSAPAALSSHFIHNSDRISTGLSNTPVPYVGHWPSLWKLVCGRSLLITTQLGLGATSRPDAGKPWPFSPTGSEGSSPHSGVGLNAVQNSKPSKSLH